MSFVNFSCSAPNPSKSGRVHFATPVAAGGELAAGRNLTRAELQNALLRFETEFSARTHDAFRQLLQSRSNTIRHQATRANLTYAITSLEIALGSIPEQNLLDMLTYLELIRVVFRDYWIPRFYKEAGIPVLNGFDQSLHEVQDIATSYLTSDQIMELKGLADAWHNSNPNRVSVETVRLSDFSSEAGLRAKKLQRQISGLFAPVAGALVASFEAIQLGERALYYGQRAPSLLAMQSTATLQDALKEVSASASTFTPTEANIRKIQAILGQSEGALKASEASLRELRPVIEEVRKLTDLLNRSPIIFEGSAKVMQNISGLLKEYGELAGAKGTSDMSQIGGLTRRIETGIKRFIQALFFGALALILFAGIVYVLARLSYDRFSRKRALSTSGTDKQKAA